MPHSGNLNTYGDIRMQLNELRSLGGGIVEFPIPAQVTTWIARVYRFRKLLQEQATLQHSDVLGYVPATPWDDLIIRREKGASHCQIEFGVRVMGKVRPLPDGYKSTVSVNAPAPEPVLSSEDEVLLDLAASLVKDIQG